jgi:hypothetical protein
MSGMCVDGLVPPQLPSLEPFEAILAKRGDYMGPTDESNWVIPSRLLGEYQATPRSLCSWFMGISLFLGAP